jgi:hypothetical protein
LTDKVRKGNHVAKSYVLKALKILGSEEILKLAEVVQKKQSFQQAAGGEFTGWGDSFEQPASAEETRPRPEGKVLAFKKERDFEKYQPPPAASQENTEEAPGEESSPIHLFTSEMHLWQRELSKSAENSLHKQQASKGYLRASEMYVVKSKDCEGKEKLRFASTDGILINKKQA